MLTLDLQGYVLHSRVLRNSCREIEGAPLTHVRDIVVHQTGGSSRQSVLASYAKPKASGAHFLIDTDGAIYQTASIYRQTRHVGRLRARCLAEHRCTPVEIKALRRFSPAAEHRREMTKSVPDRYPGNHDSVGIEIVGAVKVPNGKSAGEHGIYEKVNQKQNESLQWLVRALMITFQVRLADVFRHPTISYKNPTEAQSASW